MVLWKYAGILLLITVIIIIIIITNYKKKWNLMRGYFKTKLQRILCNSFSFSILTSQKRIQSKKNNIATEKVN